MKALLSGAVLGALVLVLGPAAVPLAAESLAPVAAQPVVLAFALGALARPVLARRLSA